MTTSLGRAALLALGFCGALSTFGVVVNAQQPDLEQRVAAVKESFQESQVRLRQFEWVETTEVSLKGEVKSSKQERCYYGADGVLQKVPLLAPAAASAPRGVRGRVAKRKKDDLTDYMDRAVNRVKHYVPPDPALIQRAKDAGKVSMTPIGPQGLRLDFADYYAIGDVMSLEIDLADNVLLGMRVKTDLGSAKDPVSLDVSFDTLSDGTVYASTIKLDAPAEKVGVEIQNTGYRPIQ